MTFTHLHLHTEYSLLDGATKLDELFERVKELGQDAVAITEHGNMGAIIKKYQMAKKAGVKLIFGFEAYITRNRLSRDKGDKYYHLLLLAKDIEGYQNLIKLVSISNNEGFYYRPRIDMEVLKKYSRGIICTSACLANDIAQAVCRGDEEDARKRIEGYIDIFGIEDFYLEVHNHGIPEEKKVMEFYERVAGEYGLKIVAAVDAHFLKEEDAYAHEVMLAVGTNGVMSDEKRFKFDGKGFWVMSEEEVHSIFPGHQGWVKEAKNISDKCNVEFEMGDPIFPDFEAPGGLSHKEFLYKQCKEGIDRIYRNKSNYKEALERMDYELSVISNMGFEAYFLIVADFINYAKQYCQVGPGRGSGAGSIVAYILGITQLDPLDLGLLFERFLNPDRISLPDFDIDFGDKDVVLNYVRKKYGEDKIAMIGTYGTMSAKAVLKDVMRVFRIPFEDANLITKLVVEKTIQKSLDAKRDGRLTDEAIQLREFKDKHSRIFEIALRLEGCVRHKGVHACGVVWGKKPIDEYIPTYSRDGDIITQVEGPDIEAYGLVKFDFLGLETLNVIKKVLDMIGKDGEWLENIPVDDVGVYEMIAKGESTGVFQIESEGMKKTLQLVQPTRFDDIIAIVALYRPGPMQYIPVYADRKHGRETPVYPHPKAEDVLSSTYGIMVYQEQIMKLSRVLAGFTAGESDTLRKAIGKKKLDLMKSMEEKFKQGCINKSGMDEKEVDKLWDDIVKFADYSFNKSHAAAYALISYRTAYLKKYFPVEFYTATISSSVRDPDKLAFYLDAARRDGIKILHPDINKSQETFSVEVFDGYNKNESEIYGTSNEDDPIGPEKVIRVGLNGIKNVGSEALSRIMQNRPYNSYQDFIDKVDLSKVNKRVCHSLISVGCFDELGVNRAGLLEVCDRVQKRNNSSEKQMTLFGGGFADEVIYPDLPDLKLKEKIDLEIELLGVAVSAHPMDAFVESKINDFTDFKQLKDDMEADIFGLVKRFTKIVTKNGEDMAFLDVTSKSGDLKVTVFPRDFMECVGENSISVGDGIKINGRYKEDEQFGDAFIAKNILVCNPVK